MTTELRFKSERLLDEIAAERRRLLREVQTAEEPTCTDWQKLCRLRAQHRAAEDAENHVRRAAMILRQEAL